MARERKADKQVSVRRWRRPIAPAEPEDAPSLELRQVPLPWPLSDTGIFVAALAVACLGITVLVGMWLIAEDVTGPDRAKLQIEALKYGLGFFAAAGAVAALLLAIRRQRLAEHTHQLALDAQQLAERNHRLARDTQAHTERDAAERRVTDLFTKAVEQIGHTDAAVRLGGLYALERVGQNNLGQRQTVVDVLCAYLRMPYWPASLADARVPDGAQREPVTDLPVTSPKAATATEVRDPRQELQVRKTAQRIIGTHLAAPPKTDPGLTGPFTADPAGRAWPDIDLDLTGALLVDWDLTRGRIQRAVFDGATFSGDTSFHAASFSGDTSFDGASFSGNAWLDGAAFYGDASFDWATFSGAARFQGARFYGGASYDEATFSDDAWFSKAWFFNGVRLSGARFDGQHLVNLEGARVAARIHREDAWPPGWSLAETEDPGWYLLIRDEPSEPSEAGPPAGSDGRGAGTSDDDDAPVG